MKKVHLLLLFLTVILVVSSVSLAEGQSTGFIISGATAVNTLNTESSATLSNLINQTAPRFVLEFANANVFLSMTDTPDALDVLLAGMNPRFIIEFANANRFLEFAFPRDLIGDTTPPQITDINTTPVTNTSTRISWTTNEIANSAVECGTNPGVYTITLFNSWYTLQHSILVSDLSPGVEYYCRVSSQDQSENLTRSNEFSFIQARKTNIFLPLLLK